MQTVAKPQEMWGTKEGEERYFMEKRRRLGGAAGNKAPRRGVRVPAADISRWPGRGWAGRKSASAGAAQPAASHPGVRSGTPPRAPFRAPGSALDEVSLCSLAECVVSSFNQLEGFSGSSINS